MSDDSKIVYGCDKSFDEQLIKRNPFYWIHQEYLPYIGLEYQKSGVKILFVGESHFIDFHSGDSDSIEQWYTSPVIENNALYKVKEHFDTRSRIQKFYENQGDRSYHIFLYPAQVLADKELYRNCDNPLSVYQHVSFMNYFQRPSFRSGKSIITSEKDFQVARETLDTVIGVIKPSRVIFLSKKAYKAYGKRDMVEVVAHPCCAWWNKREGKFGKHKLENIIEELIS